MSLSPEQIRERREGMTATDIAAIVGVHPHRSKLDVFLDKMGEGVPFDGNIRTRWGDILEAPIRADYEDRHDVRVEVHGTMRHPKHSWWMFTPDGLVFPRNARHPERGLEIKVHGRDAVFFGQLEYGEPGTDEVPAHELVQCMWGIGGSGLDRWDLVPFLDGAPVEYTIERDPELLAILEDAARRFMVDHVEKKTAPPPDGSDAWDGWLKRKWKENTADLISIDDAPLMLALVDELRAARAAGAEAELLESQTAQKLKLIIGDKAGLCWHDPTQKKLQKITWKRSKDGQRENWQTTACSMASDAALALSSNADVLASLQEVIRDSGRFGTDQLEAFNLALSTLLSIATRKPSTVIVPGTRPFNVPRGWKSAAKSDDHDNTATQGENQ